ncbi:MAG: ATP-dependent Clp protease proteolytic subunit [Alistipes sp.]|jgi:ATP-dependent Clp protease protease subunit|nr:ATP-dependent Clp protease proteolytic subunit [Alistipes sp.]
MDKRNSDTYYDIEIEFEEALLKSGFVEDVFYLRDLKQRKLFISTNICQETVDDAIRHIMQINREDMGVAREDRKPIILYVTSNGGDVDAGFALIDVILSSETPVYVINQGYQYSMGFLIGLAGHKRFAMPHAKFLMHDGSQFIYNSGAKAQDQMEFNKRMEERIKQYVLSRTEITSEMYDSQMRKEWYMFADEAKKLGVTDYIIGEDCTINDII